MRQQCLFFNFWSSEISSKLISPRDAPNSPALNIGKEIDCNEHTLLLIVSIIVGFGFPYISFIICLQFFKSPERQDDFSISLINLLNA